MSYRQRLIRLILTAAVVVGWIPFVEQAISQQPSINPAKLGSVDRWLGGPGYVLLNNDEVLKGNIEVFATAVEIELDKTGKISLSRSRIVGIGQSMAELYDVRVADIGPMLAGDHLLLCRWCLRHGLFDQAYTHYGNLRQLKPDSPILRQLESEYRQSLAADPRMRAALRGEGSGAEVAVASAESPATPGLAQEAVVSRAVYQMQAGDPALFQQVIHPVLVQSCARAACHGSFATNDFQLIDSRRIDHSLALRKNLETFTRYMTEHRPSDGAIEQHPLFAKSVSAHGLQNEPPLDITKPHHGRYVDALRAWLQRSGNEAAPVIAASATTSSAGVSQVTLNPPYGFGASLPMTEVRPLANGQTAQANAFATGQGFGQTQPLGDTRSLGAGTELRVPPSQSEPPQAAVGGELDTLDAMIKRLEAIENGQSQADAPADPAEFNRVYAPR